MSLRTFALSIRLALAVALFGVVWPAFATAGSERLQAYARIKAVEGRILPRSTALRIEAMASSLGFSEDRQPKTDLSLTPLVAFDLNINGGNPPEPLAIGGFVFHGDPENYRKSGIVVGLKASQNTRFFFGYGKYLDISTRISKTHSSQHEIGIEDFQVNVCSKNHISNWWFIDMCAEKAVTEKALSASSIRKYSLSGAKVFGDGPIQSQLSFTVKQKITASFQQNLIALGAEIVGPSTSSAVNMSFGEPTDALATKFSVDARISKTIAQTPVSVSFSFEEAAGGQFFGVPRDEKIYGININFPVRANLNASVGYMITDSTIDHFDLESPTLGFQFSPIRF